MSGGSNFSILIVDDEKTNLDILNYILKPNYTVYTAKSGQTALKRAKEHTPDLILLDVIMPDMSGFEVLAELKKSELTDKIPVIFITGLDSVEDEEKGFFLGAVDYIVKPFHNSIVKARVKTHLRMVKQMRTIERLGLIDALTDIPNRRSFDYQLNVEWGRAIREKSPIGILMMDVDNFKSYNDTYGHPQGDILLQALANVFAATLKRSTDIVARYGGEEFAVILPNTSLDGALRVAENIRANIESAIILIADDNQPTSVTISIGAASTLPAMEDEVSDFICKADRALYKAKYTGRNRVCSWEAYDTP